MLSKLSKQDREEIFSHLSEDGLERGETLFLPGDEAQGVYFVKSGRLGVQTETGFADKTQVVAFLDEGAPVGEGALAGETTREVKVSAVEKTTVYHLSVEAFAELEDANPALAVRLLKRLLGITTVRLRANSKRLARVL